MLEMFAVQLKKGMPLMYLVFKGSKMCILGHDKIILCLANMR